MARFTFRGPDEYHQTPVVLYPEVSGASCKGPITLDISALIYSCNEFSFASPLYDAHHWQFIVADLTAGSLSARQRSSHELFCIRATRQPQAQPL